MRIAVISAVYNEEKEVARLIDALLNQSRLPDEIIFVDDGSSDKTAEVIQHYAQAHPLIKCWHEQNKGPAAARNVAWRNTNADLCVFTDGDCVPEARWLERLTEPFKDQNVGATCGPYKTLNPHKIMARFIGLEIAWRYRDVREVVDAHGSYNLAVRRSVLDALGGYNEIYRVASGEDWDLTYKISRRYRLIYVPEAIVGHPHPESLWAYLQIQVRRGYDRIKIYKDHPDKIHGDTYTGRITKYQVLAAGIFIPATLLAFFGDPVARVWTGLIGLFLFGSSFPSFTFIFNRDKTAAVYGLGVQCVRYFAWFFGALLGLIKFGVPFKSGEKTN